MRHPAPSPSAGPTLALVCTKYHILLYIVHGARRRCSLGRASSRVSKTGQYRAQQRGATRARRVRRDGGDDWDAAVFVGALGLTIRPSRAIAAPIRFVVFSRSGINVPSFNQNTGRGK